MAVQAGSGMEVMISVELGTVRVMVPFAARLVTVFVDAVRLKQLQAEESGLPRGYEVRQAGSWSWRLAFRSGWSSSSRFSGALVGWPRQEDSIRKLWVVPEVAVT